jgi:hypothetical protein
MDTLCRVTISAMTGLLPAVAAVVGLIVGAVSQYFFTRRLEAARHYRELRTRWYSDFIAAVAESANAARIQDINVKLRRLEEPPKRRFAFCFMGRALS